MWRGPRTITPTSRSCSLNSASTSDHLGLQSSSTRRPSLKMRTSSTCWIIAVAVLFCVVTANLVDYAEAQKGNYCRDGRGIKSQGVETFNLAHSWFSRLLWSRVRVCVGGLFSTNTHASRRHFERPQHTHKDIQRVWVCVWRTIIVFV